MRALQNTTKRDVAALAFGAGRLVAGGRGGFEIYTLATGSQTHIPSHPTSDVTACAVDPRGRWFYFSYPRGGCQLFPLDEECPGRLPANEMDGHVGRLAASPDGEKLAVCRGEHLSRLECWELRPAAPWRLAWAICNGRRVDDVVPVAGQPSGFYSDFYYSVAFSPDGRRVCVTEVRRDLPSLELTRFLVIRDAFTGERIWETQADAPIWFSYPLEFTPDGKRLVGLLDNRIDLWNIEMHQLVGCREAPNRAYLRSLAIHPSGRFLATAGGDGIVRYWHLETLGELKSLAWEVGKLHSIAFSPDGCLAAAGGGKGRIILWDVED